MNLRLDRIATLCVADPLIRLAPKKRPTVPILMYHSVSEQDESGKHAYYRTSTSPAMFAAQIEYLHRNGYRTCSVAKAIAQLEANAPEAARSVVLTFDDGYRDFYENAFPVLNQYGFTATVYLPTAFIGESTLQFKGQDCLTWSEVRELQSHGITFGSHTVTHPQLHALDLESIEAEIVNSKSVIQENTGTAVDSFAYPYAVPQTDGVFIEKLRGVLEQAGYATGVCARIGRAGSNSDPFFLERLPVNGLDDKALFEAKLDGAYDWMAWLQTCAKSLKSRGERTSWRGDM